MRSERLYLTDIIEATDAIGRFLDGVDAEDFVENELVQKLLVIGEAAARLPAAFRERHPHVPWSQIAAFRNFAIHAYFAVDLSIVWVAATQEVPELHGQAKRLLDDS